MKQIQTIEQLSLTSLNVSEYNNFMTRVKTLIDNAGVDKLGIEQADYDEFLADLGIIDQLVKQSRASEITAQLEELDTQRDSLLTYIFDTVNNATRLPIDAMKQAATSLQLVIKPYTGIQRIATQQETAQISGLLLDLAGNMAQNVTTLGLDDMVAQLKQANDSYAALTDERTQAGAAGKLESNKTVRARMDDEYAALCNIAFANSVVNPTDETAAFVRDLNATIGEVKTRYNQRRAQAAGSTEADTTDDADAL